MTMLTHPPAATSYTAATEINGVNLGANTSGVSWPAIIAGGLTAAAISVILLLFGTGLGLASISPWPHEGLSATSFTVLAAIWLIIVQWAASLFGGYMAGRLRTKWTGVHTDEVFFRDTAHGFLAWALGTLIVAALLTTTAANTAATTTQATATIAATATQTNYFTDELFRQNANPNNTGGSLLAPSQTPAGPPSAQTHAQAATILSQGLANGAISPADETYLTQLVSQTTGLAPADAQARVQDVLNQEQAAVTKTKQIADATRKSSAAAAIYTFISLLIGAFIASVAGAIGGRLRDTY